jgi:hypothetical protein
MSERYEREIQKQDQPSYLTWWASVPQEDFDAEARRQAQEAAEAAREDYEE